MATHRISIFRNERTMRRVNKRSRIHLQLVNEKYTGNAGEEFMAVLENSGTRDVMYGTFVVPDDFVSNPAIVIPWTANETSGKARFTFGYNAVAEGEDIDQVSLDQILNTSDGAPKTAGLIQSVVLSLNAGNFVANDVVRFELGRDTSHASDNLSSWVVVLYNMVKFRYEDV